MSIFVVLIIKLIEIMKILSKEGLDIQFKKYYEENGDVATHVFIYSIKQDEISDSYSLPHDDGKKCYVKGERYSEMRSRDTILDFGFDDCNFITAGSYKDIKRK